MKTRIRILMCYVFSVVSYGRETWTYSKAIGYKSNAFEMRCYRRMLRIGLASHTTNIENWCKRNNYVKQPEQQKVVLCGTLNEKHIRISPYFADNNRRKTGRQARKRETKTNIGRRLYTLRTNGALKDLIGSFTLSQIQDPMWCFREPLSTVPRRTPMQWCSEVP